MESSLPAGEQDPSGTPPDPFPAFSGSNRTQGQLSLSGDLDLENWEIRSAQTLL